MPGGVRQARITAMQFGAVFPTTEIGDDPVAIRDYAQAAEGLGYSYLVAFDHVLGAVHEGARTEALGPLHRAAPLPRAVRAVRLPGRGDHHARAGDGGDHPAQRQTVLAAKQAAEVDVLSGGRLRLGLGTGWNYVEYEGLDVPWAQRGKRFDEQIELIRQLWGDPVVDYKGTFHRVDRAGIAPRPAHQIPIWLGGGSDVSLRAPPGWATVSRSPGAGRSMAAQAAKLRGYLSEEGRDPATFPMEFGLPYGLGPERWQKSVELAQNDGITHFSVNTMSSAAAWARDGRLRTEHAGRAHRRHRAVHQDRPRLTAAGPGAARSGSAPLGGVGGLDHQDDPRRGVRWRVATPPVAGRQGGVERAGGIVLHRHHPAAHLQVAVAAVGVDHRHRHVRVRLQLLELATGVGVGEAEMGPVPQEPHGVRLGAPGRADRGQVPDEGPFEQVEIVVGYVCHGRRL